MAALSPVVALTAASVVQQPNGPLIDQSAGRADQEQKTQTPDAVQVPAAAVEAPDAADDSRSRGADGRGQLVDIRV